VKGHPCSFTPCVVESNAKRDSYFVVLGPYDAENADKAKSAWDPARNDFGAATKSLVTFGASLKKSTLECK
jgi:hypothetical protein